MIRPRRPGHCLGPAWWAPSVQEGGGRQGVAAAAAAATATATAAAAAAAAAVVLMVGSGSSCSSGSLSRSDSSLSRGASSSSSSSSIRRRVSPVTAGLLSCTFSRVQRRRLAFFGTAPVPAARACEQACMALSRHGRSCERVRYKRMHACCVVGRVRAGSVRMLHPLLVACSLARLFVGSRPPGGGRAQVIVRSPSTHPGLS